ncbi:50S ribosomal protein L24 [Candidatus Kaiserbacteria bacterium]|nr:50S ribosomal protein L24 [Candidatus Kaiserbacteria bacterium]
MKIKKGDNVVVIAGKDRGKTGTVVRAFPKKEQVLVDGVNVAHRHQKSRRRGQQGQIIEKAMPVHVSNVALKDGKRGAPGRVGYMIEGEASKKVRITRPSGEKI